MSNFEIIAVLLTATFSFSYINYRFVRLPPTIGLVVLALTFSLSMVFSAYLGLPVHGVAEKIISEIDFHETLMNGMLSFLLFAGALHVNIKDLSRQKVIIGILSTLGLIVSTAVIGILTFAIYSWCGFNVSFIYCLLFGALISPTDPVSVLSLLKSADAPKSIHTKIGGESLFNDGVGVVVFVVLSQLVSSGGAQVSIPYVLGLFAQEALGGILLGGLTGLIAFLLLRTIDSYKVEILLTLALVTGGYAMAGRLHTSGPIAMVVAGLIIGNPGRTFAMSNTTRANLDLFWGLIDEILNAVLFVLVGLELIVLGPQGERWAISLLCIPVALFARWLSVVASVEPLRYFRQFSPHVVKILTWGGLRGGISIALALSLPVGPERNILIGATYVVVVFSILVQGLTFPRLLRFLLNRV